MKKIITKVFNFSNSPGTIIKFQWKDGIMKSICTTDMKVKTEKMDEETFNAFMMEVEKEASIVGPHLPGSLVQHCVPKIQW